MTGGRLSSTGRRTLADALRDDLKRCEEWVTKIGAGTHGLALLQLVDHVTDELERLEQRGVDLRAERGRLEGIEAQLYRRRKALVAQAGASLATQRPADARWWWHLDEQLAAERRRLLTRIAVGTLLGLALLGLAYVFYDRVLAPPPHIRQASTHVFKGERFVIEGDSAQAIEQFKAAVALNPGHAEAHLWLGVLYQAADDTERATAAFERVRALLDEDEEYFLVQRGMLYLMLNDTDAAYQDALTAIESAPDQPLGYFLLGGVAEQMGDWRMAVANFQQTAALAEETGDVELQAVARMRLAVALESLTVMPEQ